MKRMRSELARGKIPAMLGFVQPYVQLAEAHLPDGTLYSLHKHNGKFYLKNDELDLMTESEIGPQP